MQQIHLNFLEATRNFEDLESTLPGSSVATNDKTIQLVKETENGNDNEITEIKNLDDNCKEAETIENDHDQIETLQNDYNEVKTSHNNDKGI